MSDISQRKRPEYQTTHRLNRGSRGVGVLIEAERVYVPGALPQWGIEHLDAWYIDTLEDVTLTPAESTEVLRRLP